MGSFLIVAAVFTAGGVFFIHKALRSARSLRHRSVTELRQLKSELASRHLIVLHLLDSLPESFDQNFNREACQATRQQAASALESIDIVSPRAADIIASTDHEENLFRLTDDLEQRIEADAAVRNVQPVAACLLGLRDSNRKIIDAVSTYNASAITHSNYLQRPITSLVAHWMPAGEFELFDMNLYSGDSRGRAQ